MVLKVCAVFLLVAYLSCTHGAAIPSELDQVFNQFQDFLANPEPLAAAVGMRVRRDVGNWDKEFDMEALGLSFKLKYVDPSNPLKGGHVHMKFPAHRFVKAASFDDVELEFDFKGGEAIDGLFEMKFDYKFIQKFQFFADRPQQGTFTVYRKMEGGQYKTKMSLESNTKKLFEVNMESDHSTKFHGKATYDHDNTWEVTISRVPGKSINIGFLQNGVGYTVLATLDKATWKATVKITIPGKTFHLDVQMNPNGKWGIKMTGDVNGPLGVLMVMSKDMKQGEVNIKHRDNVYALINIVGDIEMTGIIPKKFKYGTTYRFFDGPGFTMHKQEGQAKVRFDGFSIKKVFTVEFTPTGGVAGKVDLSIESTKPGFKYIFEITQGGKSYLKREGVRTVTADDDNKWEAIDTSKTFMDQDSPIYKWHCKYMTYPVPCAISAEQTQKYHYDKKNKNFLLNKFSYESDIIFGGKKFSTMKIDTTKTPYVFAWDIPQAPFYYPFDGKVDLTFTPKENFGVNYLFKFTKNGQQVISINKDRTVINDANKLEIAEETKATVSEEFYKINKWYGNLVYPMAHYKEGTRTEKFFFDKKNKNFLFNKMSYEITTLLDGVHFQTFKFNTVNTPYVFNFDHGIVPYWYPLEGKFDLTFEPKSNFGFHLVYAFIHHGKTHVSGDHDVTVVSNANKFEVKQLSKQTMDEDSTLYAVHCRLGYPIPCAKNREVVRKLFVDKMNKNFIFNKMTYDVEVKLDGKVHKTIKLDTVNTPYVMTWDEHKSPFWMPSPINMFGLKMWTVTVDHKVGKELVVKSNLGDMKLIVRRKPNMFVEFIRHGETYLKATSEINPNVIKTDLNTKMYFPTRSFFCNRGSTYIGCFDKWEGDFKVFVDLKNMNVYLPKFSINGFIKKNDETHLVYEQSTIVSPYVLKITEPHLLPQLFDDPRRHSLEATMDHQVGKYLHIQTNAPEMSSFKITTDGIQRRLELNGEEVVVVDYTTAEKKFKQVLQLPNGELVAISLDWSTWDVQTNKVHMKIETPTRKINVDMDYDVAKTGRMKFKVHGENPLWGKYHLMRNFNWKVDAHLVDAKWTGQTSVTKGPLAVFSPIDTNCKVNYNIDNMVLNANIVKTIAGQKWGLNVSQNKIHLISGRP